MTIRLLALLCFCSSLSAYAQHPICYEKRLTPSSYIRLHKKTEKALKQQKSASFVERFKSITQNVVMNEQCAWNQFLYVDFFIYFDRFAKLDMVTSDQLPTALAFRDELYQRWTELNKSAVYADYSEADISDMELGEFLEKRSENFSFFTKILKIFNRRPKKKAKRFVYDLLHARSPFNSIFPEVAMELLLKEKTTQQLNCLINSPHSHIQKDIDNCFENPKQAIELLGVLSSQRMYLIRDLAAYAEQNLSEEDYQVYYQNAALSSQLYFKLETMAQQNGVETVYPSTVSEAKSRKPYHFYSVAYIALKMREAGFDEATVRKFSNKYAVKYKKNIKLVGLVYNVLIGVPLKNGSVGDAKQILEEQRMGIEYALTL